MIVLDSKDKTVEETKEMVRLRHNLVHDIEERFESFNLNTVVSGFMEYNNAMLDIAKKSGGMDLKTLQTFSILLAPFAPHLAEECYHLTGGEASVFAASWPAYDDKEREADEIKVPVQINGKVKIILEVPKDIAKEEILEKARAALGERLSGTVLKEVYVPAKIVNFVVKA